jgi:hypothetical protein
MVKALVTTLPKSGTHLLSAMLHGLGLRRHPFAGLEEIAAGLLSSDQSAAKACVQAILEAIEAAPDNAFILHHVPHTKLLMGALAQRDVRVIALIRNPFDVIVSQAHHLLARPQPDTPAGLSLHAMQHWICSGGDDGALIPPLAKRNFGLMHGWVEDGRALLLRFEELVGPRGGGLFSDQLAAGLKLREFLGLDIDTAGVTQALMDSFRPEIDLFRRGQIGSWKEEMAPNTAEQVRLGYGRVFENWGYTLDGDVIPHASARPNLVEEMDRAAAAMIGDNVNLRAKVRRLLEDRLETEPATGADDPRTPAGAEDR